MIQKLSIAELVRVGEGISVEFKSAAKGLPANVIETVSAVLLFKTGTPERSLQFAIR